MTRKRPRPDDYGFPASFTHDRLERILTLAETTFANQRERAEQLTREAIAGTVTPERWSEVVRETYEEAWRSYATWCGLLSATAKAGERGTDDEKDD